MAAGVGHAGGMQDDVARVAGAPTTAWRRLAVVLPAAVVAATAIGFLIGDAVLAGRLETEAPLPGETVYGWVPALPVLGQALLLLLRLRAPVVVLLGTTALDALVLVMSAGELGTGPIAVMIATYTVVRWRPGRATVLWVLAAAVVMVLVARITVEGSPLIEGGWALPLAVLRSVVIYAPAAAAGEYVRARARLIHALRERAELAERDRERHEAAAVLRERAAMARELHDIAAHHLSGIVLSAQAAESLLTRDPDRARGYVQTVQREAQTTLAGLRQTVGLLRTDDRGELAPVPTIAELPALVATAEQRGATVELHAEGAPVPLGPLAEAAGYRMVQESLTNAARHAAGAPVSVAVRWTEDGVELMVENAAPSGGSGGGPGGPPSGAGAGAGTSAGTGGVDGPGGVGLRGMRERAELIGGLLEVGATASSGWRNRLRIPRGGDE